MGFRSLVVLLLAASAVVAAPVPKTPDVSAALARIAVENVGAALAQPGLRKGLALTADQETALAKLSAEYETKIRDAAGATVVMGPIEPTDEVERFHKMAAVAAEFNAAAVKLFNADQIRRLQQVQLRKSGPAALLQRHAVRALALSAAQEDAMAAELAKCSRFAVVHEEMIAMLAASELEVGGEAQAVKEERPAGLVEFFKKEQEQQERVGAAMRKHLTDDQRATWAALVGPPADAGELIRAASVFGDPRIASALMRNVVREGPPPQALPVAPPPPPLPPGAPLPPALPPVGR